MKAISLMQPYASLLCAGIKTLETRSWKTKHRGLIYVHASAKTIYTMTDKMYKYINKEVSPHLLQFPQGGIIGIVNITDCQEASDWIKYNEGQGNHNDIEREMTLGDLTTGRYVFPCTDAVLFPEIVPCKGALNVWEAPENIKSLVAIKYGHRDIKEKFYKY